MTHLPSQTPAEQRDFEIYYARVLMREARARRRARSFSAALLEWAGNARRRALAINISPAQPDLFGSSPA
ncbi:MAG: hypothetical protein P0Y64_16590 [Candidatus Sphingomonas colombiensis]|nr:hypothetical protein [Sphingomonas sp.]WEK42937.1 MAG: hypothetical protein P0Y64_16590 [Sphingomonas sp.]